MKNKSIKLLAILTLFTFQSSFSQKDLKTYIFGHSLIFHENIVNPIPSQENSVPFWMNLLTQETNHSFAANGKYGFIPQHSRDPIVDQWHFESVPKVYNGDIETFDQGDFNTIMITPSNFIQWIGPNDNYWQETQSVVDFTEQVFNRVNALHDNLNLYIYENWPDMTEANENFPPTNEQWMAYNTKLNTSFHQWNLEYHDSMAERFPNQDIKMIPVGPAISAVLMAEPFTQIPIDSLYEDNSPHGRPSIYFLAALTTYMALYEEKAPSTYRPPNFIESNGVNYYMVDEIIINNYESIVDTIWEVLNNFNFPNGDSRVFRSSSTLTSNNTFINTLKNIKVVPNVIEDTFSVQNLKNKPYNLSIINLNGKTLKTYANIHNSENIDISYLTSGMYFIKIESANNEVIIKKIIKK